MRTPLIEASRPTKVRFLVHLELDQRRWAEK
jgi:hypothetical protein